MSSRSAICWKVAAAASRLPASCAACALSSKVSGSFGAMRLASVVNFLAARGIAGADRDQPVRHRLVGAHAAAIAQEARDRIGRAHDGARDRPQQHGGDGDRRGRGHQHHDRGLDALALPGDDDVARTLGQPHGAEREQRDDDEIDEDADHCGMGLMGWLLRADGRDQLRLVDA